MTIGLALQSAQQSISSKDVEKDEVFEVVGGVGKGGIIVRSGCNTLSPELQQRLSTGARVRALEFQENENRLRYELLTGSGPPTGWVSTKVKDKDLLIQRGAESTEIKGLPFSLFPEIAFGNDSESQQSPQESFMLMSCFGGKIPKAVKKATADDNKEKTKAGATALQKYGELFAQRMKAEAREQSDTMTRSAAKTVESLTATQHDELERDLGLEVGALNVEKIGATLTAQPPGQGQALRQAANERKQRNRWNIEFAMAQDSDGEEVQLCHHCRLDLGKHGYERHGKNMHGECMAQYMVQDMRADEQSRLQKARAAKFQKRKEYDIGWKPEFIPSNDGPAAFGSAGMVCLVLDETDLSVRMASTVDPAAAVNLEYLSTALQVRRKEGHEPVFSLEPVNAKDQNSMQQKVFVPDWLEGTSAGDVLFQSDYHLKELSMGEYEQPVVGMKNVFDHCDNEGWDKEWSAREWFLVRKAELQLTQNKVLVPFVKMGVEAREQKLTGNFLDDKEVTRPDHPMVKYAESFTHFFDLIAERKSVVYHLRELAKAAVIAKFLIEAEELSVTESWFNMSSQKQQLCVLEVPQLWNEKGASEVHVRDGKIQQQRDGVHKKRHGVYGGVAFGLDKFAVSAPIRRGLQSLTASAGLDTSGMLAGLEARGGIPSMSRDRGFGLRKPAALPTRISAPASSLQPLQGVDLRLDNFDLTTPKKVVPEAPLGSWGNVGEDFWSSISDSAGGVFKAEDSSLLKDIFNSEISDRRIEGNKFVPPDASFSYVTKLRSLVKEEEAMRQKRKEHFLSKEFLMSQPGELFPSSWTSKFQVAHGWEGRSPALLHPRPEYKAQSPLLLNHILRTALPVFDRSTEEGMRFRIYRMGCLEMRTTQELGREEVVGMVYSMHAPPPAGSTVLHGKGKAESTKEREKIMKATEYVESALGEGQVEATRTSRRYYLVLETDQGSKIVTEQLQDGNVTWQEDPEDLEARSTFAKVIKTGSWSAGVPVREMLTFCNREAERSTDAVSQSARKKYARTAFDRARGVKATASRGVVRGRAVPAILRR